MLIQLKKKIKEKFYFVVNKTCEYRTMSGIILIVNLGVRRYSPIGVFTNKYTSALILYPTRKTLSISDVIIQCACTAVQCTLVS